MDHENNVPIALQMSENTGLDNVDSVRSMVTPTIHVTRDNPETKDMIREGENMAAAPVPITGRQ